MSWYGHTLMPVIQDACEGFDPEFVPEPKAFVEKVREIDASCGNYVANMTQEQIAELIEWAGQ